MARGGAGRAFFLLAMPFCCRLRTARAPRVTVALVTVALRRVTPAPGTASAGRRENVRNLRGLEKAVLLYLWNPSPRNPGTMTARDLRDFRDLKKRRYCTFGRVAFQADRLGRGHEEPSGRRGNVGIMFWKCPGKWRKWRKWRIIKKGVTVPLEYEPRGFLLPVMSPHEVRTAGACRRRSGCKRGTSAGVQHPAREGGGFNSFRFGNSSTRRAGVPWGVGGLKMTPGVI